MKQEYRWLTGCGLVLAAVIIFLLIFIVPAYHAAIRANERAACQNNLKNLGLSILQYSTTKKAFPPAAHPNEDLPLEHRLSWIAEVTPYLDVAGLYNSMNWTQAWDSPANHRLTTIPLAMLRCPCGKNAAVGQTHFVGITGVGGDSPWLPAAHPRAGVFGFDRVTRLSDIKDGASSTLLVLETSNHNGYWGAGGDPTVRPVDPAQRPFIGRGRPFGGLHNGGVNALFADGSVRFLEESTDPKVLEALATVAGGEALPPNWDR